MQDMVGRAKFVPSMPICDRKNLHGIEHIKWIKQG